MTALVPVVAAALAPDASWAVTVAKDGTVRTWVHGAAASISRGAVRLTVDEPVAAALSGKVVALSGGVVRAFWAVGQIRPRPRPIPKGFGRSYSSWQLPAVVTKDRSRYSVSLAVSAWVLGYETL
jgi:hypothetical protein